MLLEYIKRYKVGLAILAGMALVLGGIAMARAEGVSGKSKVAAEQPAYSWTGVYLGGHGSFATGTLGDSGPIDLSATGPWAGLNAGANVQTGQIVWGVEFSYSWAFGDLSDVGLNNEMEFLGRVGYLWNPRTLVYVHGSYLQLDTSWGNFDGWGYGLGIETKTPMEGWSLDLRGGYKTYDVENIHSDLEANMLYVRLGLNKRFDMPVGWFGN